MILQINHGRKTHTLLLFVDVISMGRPTTRSIAVVSPCTNTIRTETTEEGEEKEETWIFRRSIPIDPFIVPISPSIVLSSRFPQKTRNVRTIFSHLLISSGHKFTQGRPQKTYGHSSTSPPHPAPVNSSCCNEDSIPHIIHRITMARADSIHKTKKERENVPQRFQFSPTPPRSPPPSYIPPPYLWSHVCSRKARFLPAAKCATTKIFVRCQRHFGRLRYPWR